MNKKLVKLLAIFLGLIALVFSLRYIIIKADSGWDSSYDFGGSDWGSSDWGSSSYDFDWGSSSSSSNYYSSGDGGDLFGVLIGFIIIVVIFSIVIADERKRLGKANYGTSISQEYYDKHLIALKMMKTYMPDFNHEEFAKQAEEIFVKVQLAWMDFDYDALKDLLTDELYNTYKSQLKALSLKKQRNIMSDFEPINFLLTGVEKTNEDFTLKGAYRVAFYDYVVDANNNVVRGTKERKIEMVYELTFVGSLDAINNKCPHCGAPLSEAASNKCAYCNSIVVSKTHKLVLSKKQAIKQGWYRG